MARRTKEDSLETRTAILEAASLVFLAKGVAKASLEEIAQKANVTRGAVYWHFKNKTDIFNALNDTLHKPFISYILEDLEKDNPAPLLQLKELCIKLFEDLAEDTHKKNLLTLFFFKCDYTGDMLETLTCQYNKKKEHEKLFQKYFQRAQQKKHISADIDTYILTKSLIYYMNGILMEILRYPDMIDIKQSIRPLMEQFFKSYT